VRRRFSPDADDCCSGGTHSEEIPPAMTIVVQR
jgi:hypothetical protein